MNKVKMQTVAATTESTEAWKTLFSGEAMVVSVESEQILHLGSVYSELTGFTEEELQGQSAFVLLPLKERDRVRAAVSQQLMRSKIAEITCQIQKKDGTCSWVRLFSRLVSDEKNGQISLNFLLDYNKEMKSYEQVKRMEQELHTLFDLIPGGAAKFECGQSLQILNASDGFYDLTGYSREEMHAAPFFGRAKELILPEDRHAMEIAVGKMIETGKTVCIEYRIRKKDDTIAWNTAYIKALPDRMGKSQMEGVFLDTTESKTLTHRFSSIVDSIEAGIAHLLLDREQKQLQVVYANESFYRLIGKTVQEVADNHYILERVVHKEDFPQVFEKTVQLFSSDGQPSSYLEFRNETGKRYLRADLSVSPTNQNGVECVLTDITESKLSELALKIAEERYRIVYEGTQDVVFEWDMRKDRSYHSPMFLKKFGYELPETGQPEYILQSDVVHSEDKKRCADMLRVLKGGSSYAEAEYRIKKADGNYIWCRVRGTVIKDADGTPSRALGVISDISSEKLKLERLKEQAQRDLLTGLYNADTVQLKMEELLRKSSSFNRHLLIIFDLDGLEELGQKYEKAFRDSMIVKISAGIQGKFRESDVIGRLAENRFVLLLKNISDKGLIKQKVDVLQSVFHDIQLKGTERLIVSIGVSLYPQDGLGLSELMTKAEIALEEAKSRGGGECVFYNEHMPLHTGEFRPSYSPNTIEYSRPTFITTVLDILYHTEDQNQALQLVLSWMGQHLQMEHIYIYEIIDNRAIRMRHEYCSRTAVPFQNNSAMQSFNEELLQAGAQCGIVCVNRNTLGEEQQRQLEGMGIDLLLQVPLYKEGRCRGIFGFCDSRLGISWNSEQIETATFLAKVINAYLFLDS